MEKFDKFKVIFFQESKPSSLPLCILSLEVILLIPIPVITFYQLLILRSSSIAELLCLTAYWPPLFVYFTSIMWMPYHKWSQKKSSHLFLPNMLLLLFFFFFFQSYWAAVTQTVNNLPAMQETWVWSLGWEDPLEKEMAIHSSILAWKIPWTEEPGGLQSVGSPRVGHWMTNTFTFSPFIQPLEMDIWEGCLLLPSTSLSYLIYQ